MRYGRTFHGPEKTSGSGRAASSALQPSGTEGLLHRGHDIQAVDAALTSHDLEHTRVHADALGVSAHSSRLKRARIKEIISERTASRFGRPVNVHLFRDAAATAVAIGDPEHVGIIAAILGHGAAQTGERFYNQATSIEAARRFQTIWHAYREPQGSTVRR